MNTQKKFWKKISIITGVMIAILALEITAIVFITNYLRQQTSNINQNREILASARAERFNAVSLKNDFNKAKDYFSAMDSALPNEDNLYIAKERLEDLGNKNGVQSSVQLDLSQILTDSATGNRFISFTASINGDYSAVRNYLKDLSNNFIFAEIDNISITNNKNINNVSSVNISGKVFVK